MSGPCEKSSRLTVADIVRCLGTDVKEVHGNGDRVVTRPATLDDPESAHSVTFCSATGGDAAKAVASSEAAVIVCRLDVALACRESVVGEKTLIAVENPRLSFLRLVSALFVCAPPEGIHESAVVDNPSKIGEGVSIGPFAYVGDASIGDGSIIHGHVHIYDGAIIGKNVTIHAGTVIGADGFGYERNEQGTLEKFPQIGNVVIEDNVEIGANACIDRGALGSTIIREGAKIDNLVYVAHNVTIGRDSLVIALAAVMGSTTVGDESWIAPGATLRDKIAIGRGATVGLGAVVVNDVPDGAVVAGIPARPLESRAKS